MVDRVVIAPVSKVTALNLRISDFARVVEKSDGVDGVDDGGYGGGGAFVD